MGHFMNSFKSYLNIYIQYMIMLAKLLYILCSETVYMVIIYTALQYTLKICENEQENLYSKVYIFVQLMKRYLYRFFLNNISIV